LPLPPVNTTRFMSNPPAEIRARRIYSGRCRRLEGFKQ
jgi:hypothetical protein